MTSWTWSHGKWSLTISLSRINKSGVEPIKRTISRFCRLPNKIYKAAGVTSNTLSMLAWAPIQPAPIKTFRMACVSDGLPIKIPTSKWWLHNLMAVLQFNSFKAVDSCVQRQIHYIIRLPAPSSDSPSFTFTSNSSSLSSIAHWIVCGRIKRLTRHKTVIDHKCIDMFF